MQKYQRWMPGEKASCLTARRMPEPFNQLAGRVLRLSLERHIEEKDILLRSPAEGAQTAALIGWMLGGVIARETARAIPDVVSGVITYGTPVIGGPTYTPAARALGAAECRRLSAEIEKLDAENPNLCHGPGQAGCVSGRQGLLPLNGCHTLTHFNNKE
ncbi:MAG: alpha/beta hydrolase [Bacteroidales bacterium]